MLLDFIKKQWIAFYASIVVIVLAIVSLSIYGSNAANAYFESSANGTIIALTVIAIILDVVVLIVSQFSFAKENKPVKYLIDIMLILISLFLVMAFMSFVSDRVYYIAVTYGSDLEEGNQAAFDAVGQTIVGFVMYGITIALSIASSFFSVTRKEIA